jgi:hypothetical protein
MTTTISVRVVPGRRWMEFGACVNNRMGHSG